MSGTVTRHEGIRQTVSRIFREPYYPLSQKRVGTHILSQPLYGPTLKSHWPLRIQELNKFWKASSFCSEMPLPGALRYVNVVANAHSRMPYPVSRVYRLFIGEWRHNRGKNIKKGESKITATNLGKIGRK